MTGLSSGMKSDAVATVYERVLNNAGAVPRDAADQRAVSDTRSGGGKKADTMKDLGGYPKYEAGAYSKDTDGDALPDAWETANGLNPNDARDAARFFKGGAGYLNIEVYVNSLIPGTFGEDKR